jgi:hypothetical protein
MVCNINPFTTETGIKFTKVTLRKNHFDVYNSSELDQMFPDLYFKSLFGWYFTSLNAKSPELNNTYRRTFGLNLKFSCYKWNNVNEITFKYALKGWTWKICCWVVLLTTQFAVQRISGGIMICYLVRKTNLLIIFENFYILLIFWFNIRQLLQV